MNEIQPKPTNAMQSFNGLRGMAETFIKSGLAPSSIRTPEQAMLIAAAGSELGVPFMASMRSINVIQNRPTASVQLKLALAMNTGELEDFSIERKVDEVVATIKRKGRTPVSLPFGKKDAQAMKLIGKDNYEKQAMTMYQWRALGAVLDIAFADVLLGFSTDHSSVDLPTLMEAQYVAPVESSTPAPTAVQEVIQANQAYTEEKKAGEFGSTSEEVTDLVKDIKDKLAQMNEGNLDAMEDHLKQLTTYKDKTGKEKFVEMIGLSRIQMSKPSWLLVIHKKVTEDYIRFLALKQEDLPLGD